MSPPKVGHTVDVRAMMQPMKRTPRRTKRERKITQALERKADPAKLNYAHTFARLMLSTQPGDKFLSTMLAEPGDPVNEAKALAIEAAISELITDGLLQRYFRIEQVQSMEVKPKSEPLQGGTVVWLERADGTTASPHQRWVGIELTDKGASVVVKKRSVRDGLGVVPS